MNHIYIPTAGAEDWKRLLASPDRQWRIGFSARSLAQCWESAQGFPPEVRQLFSQSQVPAFRQVELLLAIPEHQVSMPPRSGHPSQNDLFALGRAGDGQLIAITVEGKVVGVFEGNPRRQPVFRLGAGQREIFADVTEIGRHSR